MKPCEKLRVKMSLEVEQVTTHRHEKAVTKIHNQSLLSNKSKRLGATGLILYMQYVLIYKIIELQNVLKQNAKQAELKV